MPWNVLHNANTWYCPSPLNSQWRNYLWVALISVLDPSLTSNINTSGQVTSESRLFWHLINFDLINCRKWVTMQWFPPDSLTSSYFSLTESECNELWSIELIACFTNNREWAMLHFVLPRISLHFIILNSEWVPCHWNCFLKKAFVSLPIECEYTWMPFNQRIYWMTCLTVCEW